MTLRAFQVLERHALEYMRNNPRPLIQGGRMFLYKPRLSLLNLWVKVPPLDQQVLLGDALLPRNYDHTKLESQLLRYAAYLSETPRPTHDLTKLRECFKLENWQVDAWLSPIHSTAKVSTMRGANLVRAMLCQVWDKVVIVEESTNTCVFDLDGKLYGVRGRDVVVRNKSVAKVPWAGKIGAIRLLDAPSSIASQRAGKYGHILKTWPEIEQMMPDAIAFLASTRFRDSALEAEIDSLMGGSSEHSD